MARPLCGELLTGEGSLCPLLPSAPHLRDLDRIVLEVLEDTLKQNNLRIFAHRFLEEARCAQLIDDGPSRLGEIALAETDTRTGRITLMKHLAHHPLGRGALLHELAHLSWLLRRGSIRLNSFLMNYDLWVIEDMEADAFRWQHRFYRRMIEYFDSGPAERFNKMLDEARIAEFGSDASSVNELLSQTKPEQIERLQHRFEQNSFANLSADERLLLRASWAQFFDSEYMAQLRYIHQIGENQYILEQLRQPLYVRQQTHNIQTAIAARRVMRVRLGLAAGASAVLGGAGYTLFW